MSTPNIGKRAALRTSLLLASTLVWTSCATERTQLPLRPGRLIPQPAAAPAPALERAEHTFVLLVIDGVRHQDVFAGVDRALATKHALAKSELLSARELAPNLHALMERGATLGGPGSSAGIAASGPNFMSAPGYMEMMTGRRPSGCADNGCPATIHPTVADDFARVPGTTPLEVGVIASWEGVGRAAASDPSKVTISVGRHQGETRELLRYDAEASRLLDSGEKAGPEPGHSDYRRDRETAAIGLRYLKKMKPKFLFLGLGDTDEYAHRDDYRGYLKALSYADHVVGQVTATLRLLEREGRRTTLFVTTDHGRAADFSGHGGWAPESAAVWLVAAGHGIQPSGPASPSTKRHLADVAATLRALGGVGSHESSSSALFELTEDGRLSLGR